MQATKTHQKLYGLDHLRCLAITLVYIFHYGRIFPHPEWTNTYSVFGWSGVDLFFVLSGYLIASQLLQEVQQNGRLSLKKFYTKRFFRIIPAYLLTVAIYFFFPASREREAPAPLWKYLTFTQNIGLDIKQQGTFSHAWSLCIEEQFYFLLPLILIAVLYFKWYKKAWLLVIFLFVSGFFIRHSIYEYFIQPLIDANENYGIEWYKRIYYPGWCRLDGLLAGIGVAVVMQSGLKVKEQLLKHGNLLLITGLIILTVAYFMCYDQETYTASIFGFPVIAIGYGLLVFGAISPNSFLYKYESKLTSKIAALSYGIYLIHKIVIHVSQYLLASFKIDEAGNMMFVLCTIVVIIAALLLNEAVEKPFLNLRRKILKQGQA